MGRKTKIGKGRLDKFYQLAKEQGYRSRAAFKLVQLNKKYDFLTRARGCIDLCAAPGSWLQVASKNMPVGSKIIGVDLVPIKPVRNVVTFTEDITTQKCYAALSKELDGHAVDLVLSDGAPNVGAAWAQDAFTQSALTLHSCRLASEFLAPGGTFVTKVFRSADYHALLYVFNQLFGRVEATKPQASRNASAEIFVVCLDFKNPKIDPRLLDPKFAFEELDEPSRPSDIFAKKHAKRKRDGYEEGNFTQHKSCPIFEFINSTQPVLLLADYNELTISDKEAGQLTERKEGLSPEIKILCSDLRVLGKRDFKTLLKWRMRIREEIKTEQDEQRKAMGDEDSSSDESSGSEEDEGASEQRLLMEMKTVKDKVAAQAKREKKRLKRKRMKSKARQIMGGETAVDFVEDMELFHLKNIRGAGAVDSLVSNSSQLADASSSEEDGSGSSSNEDEASYIDSADEGSDDGEERGAHDGDTHLGYADVLEDDLDAAYEQFSSRREEAKARAPAGESDDLYAPIQKESKRAALAAGPSELIASIPEGSTSRAASLWFQQPMFAKVHNNVDSDEDDVDGDETGDASTADASDSESDNDMHPSASQSTKSRTIPGSGVAAAAPQLSKKGAPRSSAAAVDADADFEAEPTTFGVSEPVDGDDSGSDDGSVDDDDYDSDEKAVVEALAPIMIRKKSREEFIDAGYNRYANNDDQSILPKWFLDDERKHHRPMLPITQEEARAMRDAKKAINDRPIKKVAEAKARKKRKDARRMEKVKAKAESIVEADGVSAKAKMRALEKLMKASKEKKPDATYVVTAKSGGSKIVGKGGGANGSRSVKVDRRLKADKRGLKAKEKRSQGKRSHKKRGYHH